MSNAYIRFWGVRGSYATPYQSHMKVGGNTSCVELRVNNQILVCDAGTGIIPLGNYLMTQTDIRTLLIILTHYHWDHICGLPFFVPAFIPTWHLKFFGPGKNREQIEYFISQQMKPPFFPIETEQWLSQVEYIKENPVIHGPFTIYPFNVHHPGSTFGYRIKVKDKTIVYVSDNELSFARNSIDQSLTEKTYSDEEFALMLAMKEEEKQTELRFMRGADILIHDAQYTYEDYQKKRGWGHSCYLDTVACAIEAQVKQLYLYHHDPYYSDERIEVIYQHALQLIADQKSSMQCHLAKEGNIIPL